MGKIKMREIWDFEQNGCNFRLTPKQNIDLTFLLLYRTFLAGLCGKPVNEMF